MLKAVKHRLDFVELNIEQGVKAGTDIFQAHHQKPIRMYRVDDCQRDDLIAIGHGSQV